MAFIISFHCSSVCFQHFVSPLIDSGGLKYLCLITCPVTFLICICFETLFYSVAQGSLELMDVLLTSVSQVLELQVWATMHGVWNTLSFCVKWLGHTQKITTNTTNNSTKGVLSVWASDQPWSHPYLGICYKCTFGLNQETPEAEPRSLCLRSCPVNFQASCSLTTPPDVYSYCWSHSCSIAHGTLSR